MSAETVSKLPINKHACAIAQDKTRATLGSSAPGDPYANLLRPGNNSSRANACNTRALPTKAPNAEDIVDAINPMTTIEE